MRIYPPQRTPPYIARRTIETSYSGQVFCESVAYVYSRCCGDNDASGTGSVVGIDFWLEGEELHLVSLVQSKVNIACTQEAVMKKR